MLGISGNCATPAQITHKGTTARPLCAHLICRCRRRSGPRRAQARSGPRIVTAVLAETPVPEHSLMEGGGAVKGATGRSGGAHPGPAHQMAPRQRVAKMVSRLQGVTAGGRPMMPRPCHQASSQRSSPRIERPPWTW